MRTITDYITADTILPRFLPYPYFLLKMDLSHTARLLYGLLLDRSTLSQKNGWQDSEGRTYIVYPVSEITEMLDKGSTAIKSALNELDAAGLLVRERRGFSAPNRLYVKIPQMPVVQFSDHMTAIQPENRPSDSRKSDPHKDGKPTFALDGKPTPNQLTINQLKESQRKGVSGEPVTSKPVYGYLMDEDENFIIDEEAAPVVKQIYSLCLAGNGPTKIARMLTEQEIPTPGTLEYRRTGRTRRYHPGYECKWAANTVVHILENREYTGCLVNFKTTTQSYKCSKIIYNSEDKQAIFENHHEQIIDKDTWERVQELRKQRKRPNRYDEVGLFSGILFCADCGSVMYQQRYQTDKRKQDCYICGSYKKRTADCTAHFIRTDLLTAGVTENLRKVTSYAAKHEARFMKLLTEQTEDGSKRRNAAKKKELEAAEKRIAELSAIFKRLYEDSVTGRISDERFTELSADYEAEQKELKEKAAALQSELSKTLEATANAEKFMKVVRKYTSFEELTPTLLREFVEKIVIHESEALDGKRRGKLRRQEIEIYYSFVGKVELPD